MCIPKQFADKVEASGKFTSDDIVLVNGGINDLQYGYGKRSPEMTAPITDSAHYERVAKELAATVEKYVTSEGAKAFVYNVRPRARCFLHLLLPPPPRHGGHGGALLGLLGLANLRRQGLGSADLAAKRGDALQGYQE